MNKIVCLSLDSQRLSVQVLKSLTINGSKNLILFNEKIGFVNSKYKEKFEKFVVYSRLYDKKILGLSSKKVKEISEVQNKLFEMQMAAPGIEPGIYAS